MKEGNIDIFMKSGFLGYRVEVIGIILKLVLLGWYRSCFLIVKVNSVFVRRRNY